MWKELPKEQREEYKKLILAFASLTEAFAQKAGDDNTTPGPIINSKYQETVFKKAFNATTEDIGNTSYDSSINDTVNKKKYLIGIKTFGYDSGDQKVAQFKANLKEWASILSEITNNSTDEAGYKRSKEEADSINKELYLRLAYKISELRNQRIDSSIAQIQGFSVAINEENIESVYHVLMASSKGKKPTIFVGETNYDKIDIDNIRICGSTGVKNPSNFEFTDGKHKYKFTAADSQLYMSFNNKNIIMEKWDVKYAQDVYEIFCEIAKDVYGDLTQKESYSWKIANKKGEVERFSGFNAFYGVGSKLSTSSRESAINKIKADYVDDIPEKTLESIIMLLKDFSITPAPTEEDKLRKVSIRKDILRRLEFVGNENFSSEVKKLLFRPQDELYIPFPGAKRFHTTHPDFFAPGAGSFEPGTSKLALDKSQRKFRLVFDPSGESIDAFITQDAGKAIESFEKQSYLGNWILRKVFQLDEYEPLTARRLNEIGINGIRLTKYSDSQDIHLEFIWIDNDNPPEDLIK